MGDEEKLKILIEAQNKSKAAFDEAQKQIGDTEKKYSTAMSKMDAASDKMKSAGSKMTKYLTLPIAAGAALSIKAFSDLQETMSKVEVTFGKNADAMKKWSEGSLKSMGLAQQSALDSAALFGDMGSGMGQTAEQQKKMSKGLTQLGADMASFKNVSFERAQTALAGVYTGETEALKGLGIVMTETNLNAFAVSSGFIKVDKNSTAVREAALKQKEAQDKLNDTMKKHGKSSTETAKAQIDLEKANAAFDKSMQGTTVNMTQAEKVQLRYNYVMANTKNAQGDFARTSDSIANKQRIAKEQAKQLSAELGGKLAPVYAKLLEVGTKVLDWFGGLSKGQQDLIVKAALVAAAVGPVVRVMGSLTKGITGSVKATKTGIKAGKDMVAWVQLHSEALVKNSKAMAKNSAASVKSAALKTAEKAKTIALTVAEKARTVATKIGTAIQAAFNAVMAMNPIYLVVIAVVALVAIMVVLYKKNKAVRDFIDKAWRAIARTFMSVFNAIKGVVMGVFNWLKSNWQLVVGIILGPLALIIVAFTKYKKQTMAVFRALWEAVKWAWNAIVTVIKWAWENVIKGIWNLLVAYVTNILIPVWTKIWDVIKAAWNGIVAVIQWAWNNVIKPVWDLIVAYVTNILIPGWQKIWQVIQVVWNSIVTVVTWAWNSVIKPLWDLIYAYITTVLIPTWKKIFDIAKQVWDGVWAAIQGAWNFIKPIFEAIWGYITNTLVPIFQAIWDKVSDVFTKVWNKISSFISTIKDGFNKVKEFIQGLIDKFVTIKDKVSSAFTSVANAITAPFKSAFNTVAGLWNKTLGKLNFTIPSWVPGLGGNKFSMPKIDTLYKGTRDWSGGAAVVGDVRGKGGEIVHMPRGSDVYNNRESKRILRSLADGTATSGGAVVHNDFHGDIILQDASAVKEWFKQLNREGELEAMRVAV